MNPSHQLQILGNIENDQLGPALLSLAFYCIMEYSVAHSDIVMIFLLSKRTKAIELTYYQRALLTPQASAISLTVGADFLS